jgi:hypothetical protein
MASKTGAIIAMGGGVILVYMGYTGTLGQVWSALRGGAASAAGFGSGTGSGSGSGSGLPPTTTGPTPGSGPGTGPSLPPTTGNWAHNCPSGQHWDGKNCQPCSTGYVWLNGACRIPGGGGEAFRVLRSGAMFRGDTATGGQASGILVSGKRYVGENYQGGESGYAYPLRTGTMRYTG